MVDYSHSRIVVILSLILSSIHFINLYLAQSFLWVPLGICLILNFIYITNDLQKFKSFSRSMQIPIYLTRIVLSLSLIIVLLSSIASLINISLLLFGEGSTDLLIFLCISSILLFGSSLGLIKKLFV
ncbi:Hypothetical protein P9211_09291 [Prochlorococcus marinus str. MIT 9211]|uniref:Uncharacterized protein n=1 Tax=Prochlorococcus marinus (strain MIT 9211) TaxID=93059 RepID=A9BAJ8_PROM4|nr:Hypothetical protein P9211_09291 [Prochlorococcus marinus str. MIT 9211]